MSNTKICNQCNEEKPQSEYFEKYAFCKTCSNEKRRSRYQRAKLNPPTLVEPAQVPRPEPGVPEYVYCLTDPQRYPAQFKIGKHKGHVEALLKRYHTAIPNCEIIRIYKTNDARYHEAMIHKKLADFRLPRSEWFKFSEDEATGCIDTYFMNINSASNSGSTSSGSE